jgi:serine/threonine-protein kinase
MQTGHVVDGRYEVLRFIGEGGMQFVYEARDNVIGRLVALKTPKNRSATKRFRRSAVVAARVNHPNVAKTLDYLKADEQRFLVEELIRGEDLASALLKGAKVLDPYLAAHVFHHLAKGVAAAHHAGVVHRDLKPTNVMVSGGYNATEIKLTDFGIAKLAEEELEAAAEGGAETLSLSQTAVGALPYMAPEAIERPKEVGKPADVWSLGAMMYHLLTGEPPFGMGLKAVRGILTGDVPPPPPFVFKNPQFKPLAEQVLLLALECLKKVPEERPTSDQVVQACERLCYSATVREQGRVRRIDHGKYGFIAHPAGDVFFHMNCVYGPERPKVGDTVVFSRHSGGGADRAYPVMKLVAVAP